MTFFTTRSLCVVARTILLLLLPAAMLPLWAAAAEWPAATGPQEPPVSQQNQEEQKDEDQGDEDDESLEQQEYPADPIFRQPAPQYPWTFVTYGDVRFTDPAKDKVSYPWERVKLIEEIAEEKPAFVAFTGDIVNRGSRASDWAVYDAETKPWRDAQIPVYPVIGNHDVQGDDRRALGNYFARYPELQERRWYSFQYANTYFLMLDSTADISEGSAQWRWLVDQLDSRVPSDADFVFLMLHHPPYTRSASPIMKGKFRHGHSAREREEVLAFMLEEKRVRLRAQMVLLAGHVHNYERYQYDHVMYVVTGGGGATPYTFRRLSDDFYHGRGPTFHYCRFTIHKDKLEFQMVKLEREGNEARWSVADSFELRRLDKPPGTESVSPGTTKK
jgi:predicted phosphodiesterase